MGGVDELVLLERDELTVAPHGIPQPKVTNFGMN
jgi:hypothetical protein